MHMNRARSFRTLDFVAIGAFLGIVIIAAVSLVLYTMHYRFSYLYGASIFFNVILLGALLVCRLTPHKQVSNPSTGADLTHTARLTLAGEISASIIHEVIQPLSSILVNIEAIELRLANENGDVASTQEIIRDLKRDQQRASEIARRLRRFLSNRELQLENMDMNELIAKVMELVRTDFKKRNVIASTTLEPGLPRVIADPMHLQQVLLTLLINGMEAMEGTPVESRQLHVNTRCIDKRRIEVVVTDNGPKMSQDQFKRAFEPFFTTKEAGMGLGLSVASSIVVAHHGAIWVERRAAGGASFHFTIPVVRQGQKNPNASRTSDSTAISVP